MKLHNYRDLWAGLMFVAAGVLFMVLSTQYSIGTAAKMGPGYFPFVLGGVMALLGLIITFGAFTRGDQKVDVVHLEPMQFKPIFLILVAVGLFAVLLNSTGVMVALVVLIVVSALASHEFSWSATLGSIVVLAIMSYVVFVKGLELQFPVWPPFLTGS